MILVPRLTLVVQADVTGVEADVVLIFVALVLGNAEENSVLHLQPELPVSVLQQCLILLLEGKDHSD